MNATINNEYSGSGKGVIFEVMKEMGIPHIPAEDGPYTCKICETPIDADEMACMDELGNCWHRDCDGEDDFYEEAEDE